MTQNRATIRPMRFIFTLIATLLVSTGSQAETLSFPPQHSGIVQFTTPAREVGCTYIPFDGAGGIETGTGTKPELHCYTLAGKFRALSLSADGRTRKLVVRGKLDCCKGKNVLAYGSTWVTGVYSCTAYHGGLHCKVGKTIVGIGVNSSEWDPKKSLKKK